MITLRKLASLKPDARLRKAAALLARFEQELAAGRPIDLDYVFSIASLLAREPEAPARVRSAAALLGEAGAPDAAVRSANALRHAILAHLGSEPAEWDFVEPPTGRLDAARRTTFPIALYLDDVRSPFNVGSIVRSSESFGVSRILVSEGTPLPTHPRAARAAMGCEQVVSWDVAPDGALDGEAQLFALELGGTPLDEFRFPERGTAIIGSEELGVSPRLLALADARLGRVTIPLYGAKRSLNVASAVSILLYRWAACLNARR